MKDAPPQTPDDIASLVEAKRKQAGLSFGQLAQLSGISKSHLYRIEQGETKSIPPHMLAGLSEPLGVPLADLYAAAGYKFPGELPTLDPYLRSRYRDLPPEARAEITDSFSRIAAKYGYAPAPENGEDEH